MHKLIFWRQVTQTLKDMHASNKDNVDNHIISQQGEIEKYTGTRVSRPNPQGPGEAQPVSARTGKPVPEVVRVFSPRLVWPLVPGT